MKHCIQDKKVTTENEEERLYANDFEDKIQDFVYIEHSDYDFTGEELPQERRRRKRQSDEFPETRKLKVSRGKSKCQFSRGKPN